MSTTNTLTQQERRAYTILSELFLDMEYTQWELNGMASFLRPLGIPVSTLEHMLAYDLFPILYPNLLSVAGVWQAFDEEWLLQEVQARKSTGGSGWLKGAVDFVAWHTIGRIGVWPVWNNVKKSLIEDPDSRL